ncbi:alpha/beta-hydrolase [Ramaria rubella]|nr:alpha/beta-hydrolase [Ramaria rubella]
MPTPLPPARGIPSTFRESFRSWWAVGEKESAASEERLLRTLPYFLPKGTPTPTPAPPVHARSSFIPLSNPAHYINTLSFLPASPSRTTPPVVLLHGYGAGLGFFFHNFPALGTWAAQRQTPLYALDWLGMGRSARPAFRVRARREDIAGRVEEAEAFFVRSLEEWRERVGVERMTLVGHSLGAYVSVVYALRYPERVARLVLLSPAGVPHDPNGTTLPARELDGAPEGVGEGTGVLEGPGSVRRLKEEQKAQKREESRLRRIATHLWEEGWSPFQVVRSTLFWGPMLVGKYSSRRFSGLTEEETRNMHDYILNITLAKGSGEYCISHILAPGAHARMPLVDRVAPLKIPVTFVYGEHDWMDPEGGVKAVEKLRAAGNADARTCIVPGAGHHVYLDNSAAVNKLLVKELDKTVGRGL